MTKSFFILLSFLIVQVVYAQPPADEPINVAVEWKVGDEKVVMQVDSTVIFNSDSLYLSVGTQSQYNIKIVNANDSVYEVLFKQLNVNSSLGVQSDVTDASSIEKMLKKMLEEIQRKMVGLEYSFLVTSYSAQAYEIKNEEELSKIIEEVVMVVLNDFIDASKVELDTAKKSELKLKVKQYIDEQMPAAMQTMLNSFNYIFQAYSFPFVLGKTHTMSMDVYNVDEVQHAGDTTQTQFVITSSLKDPILSVNYVYKYNQEEAYQAYIVQKGKSDEISREEFRVDERVEAKFNTNSSWITASHSYVDVKMGPVVVHKKTAVTIK